jgi:hypothetical protein
MNVKELIGVLSQVKDQSKEVYVPLEDEDILSDPSIIEKDEMVLIS